MKLCFAIYASTALLLSIGLAACADQYGQSKRDIDYVTANRSHPPAVEPERPADQTGGCRVVSVEGFGLSITSVDGGEIERCPRVIRAVTPDYPVEALQRNLSEMVAAEALVDSSGHVVAVKILTSGGYFDKSVIKALQQWNFTSALRSGRSIPFAARIEFEFNPGVDNGD